MVDSISAASEYEGIARLYGAGSIACILSSSVFTIFTIRSQKRLVSGRMTVSDVDFQTKRILEITTRSSLG